MFFYEDRGWMKTSETLTESKHESIAIIGIYIAPKLKKVNEKSQKENLEGIVDMSDQLQEEVIIGRT